MRARRISLVPNRVEPHVRLGQRAKHVQVQACVTPGAIEAFRLTVLPRLARITLHCVYPARRPPDVYRQRYALGPNVTPQGRRRAVLRHQGCQPADDARR